MKILSKLAIVGLLLILLMQGQAGGDIPSGEQVKGSQHDTAVAAIVSQQVKPQLAIKVTKPEKPVTTNVPAPSESKTKAGVSAENIPLGQLYNQYPETVFRKGASDSNKIALTFDDGPSEVTCGQVLDVLKQKQVKATFFLLGQYVTEHPAVAHRIVEEGHVVGNHSWSHPNLKKASLERMEQEIVNTEEVIYELTGLKPNLFRPPYGELNRDNLEFLAQRGYKVISWSSDSKDWQYPNDLSKVRHHTLKDTDGGAILLFHTPFGREQSQVIAKLLPELIDTLKAQGYQFVTVDELLGLPAYR